MCNYTVYCNLCTAMHETTSAVTRGKETEKSYSAGQRYQDTHPEGQAPHILFAESANSELYGFLIFACASLEISALLDCYVHAFQEHKMGYILWRRPDACFEDFPESFLAIPEGKSKGSPSQCWRCWDTCVEGRNRRCKETFWMRTT